MPVIKTMSRAPSSTLNRLLSSILVLSTLKPESWIYDQAMSFSDLRKARDQRQASYVRGNGAVASATAHREEGKALDVSKTLPLYTFREGLYSALGDSFEVRVDKVMGRGVYVKSTLRDRIEAGKSLAMRYIIVRDPT